MSKQKIEPPKNKEESNYTSELLVNAYFGGLFSTLGRATISVVTNPPTNLTNISSLASSTLISGLKGAVGGLGLTAILLTLKYSLSDKSELGTFSSLGIGLLGAATFSLATGNIDEAIIYELAASGVGLLEVLGKFLIQSAEQEDDNEPQSKPHAI